MSETSVTISCLFTDLVSSTESPVTEQEEFVDTLRSVLTGLLRAEIAAAGGVEIDNQGDGLMAVFTGCAEAVRCAIGMQQAVEGRRRRSLGSSLGLRVGVAAGKAIVADGAYLGTPVVEAAGLCAAAKGGQILATDVVKTDAGGQGKHRVVGLGPMSITGLAEPVHVFELPWPADVASRVTLPPLVALPERCRFVARERERQWLDKAWEEVAAGGRVTVMVAGEPGIGKTRLISELARAAFSHGSVVLVGRCTEETLTPYQPFVEALDFWVASSSKSELGRRCANPAQLAHLLPRLAERLPGTAVGAAGQPESERWHLFEAVGSLLAAIGEDLPVVLMLEDLHWTDPATLLLIAHLARRADQPRLLLIGTYRDSEVGPTHALFRTVADLRRHHLVERITLDGLDQAATVQLLDALGGVAATPLGPSMHDRTEGNPFFVEELWRHVVETRVLGSATQPIAEDALDTPESVRDVVADRVRLLSEEAQRALAHASVLGHEFDFDILLRMVGVDRGALVAAVEEGLGAQLLLAGSDRFALTFAFTHVLVRDTLYHELSPARRRDLHRHAAEAIEAAGPAVAVSELAHHWFAARNLPRALVAALGAAAAAEEVYASTEVHNHLERALDLWDRVPDAPALVGMDHIELLRRAAEAAHLAGASDRASALIATALEETQPDLDPARVGLLHERLGRYRWMGGDTSAASASYEEAVRLLSDQPPSVHLTRVLAAQGHLMNLLDRHIEAEVRSREAIAMAQLIGAEAERGYALATLGSSVGFMGRIDESVAYLEEARRISERVGRPEDVVRTYVNECAMLLYEAGRLEDAARVALEGLELARRLGLNRSIGAMAAAYAADAFLRLGRWSEADSLTSDEVHFEAPPPMAIPLFLVRAELEIRRGRLGEAGRLLDRADRLSAGMPEAKNRGYFHLREAELAVSESRADDAREAVRKGLVLVAAADNDRFGPEMCALGVRAEANRVEAIRGRVHPGHIERSRQVAGDLVTEVRRLTRLPLERGTTPSPDAAAFAIMCEAEYSRLTGGSDPGRWAAAVASWDSVGQPYQAAYARYREAEALLVNRRSAKRASEALSQALQVAIGLEAAPLVADIHRLAARAHLEVTAPAAVPAKDETSEATADLHLTKREAEVLQHLALGETNRQIATALFISEKTASVHVSNILRKLDVGSRVEAGAVFQRTVQAGPLEQPPPS